MGGVIVISIFELFKQDLQDKEVAEILRLFGHVSNDDYSIIFLYSNNPNKMSFALIDNDLFITDIVKLDTNYCIIGRKALNNVKCVNFDSLVSIADSTWGIEQDLYIDWCSGNKGYIIPDIFYTGLEEYLSGLEDTYLPIFFMGEISYLRYSSYSKTLEIVYRGIIYKLVKGGEA